MDRSGRGASKAWKCGYCNREVGSQTGRQLQAATGHLLYIRLCSYCNGPTLFLVGDEEYSPGPLPGNPVTHLPAEIESLFTEARAATAAGAYTAAVLTCRKILMHIAVEKRADENKNFLEYVTYLIGKGYAPPNSKDWIDYIRTRSNEANHQIVLMKTEDATALVTFIEMLLRFIYELPGSVPAPIPPVAASPLAACARRHVWVDPHHAVTATKTKINAIPDASVAHAAIPGSARHLECSLHLETFRGADRNSSHGGVGHVPKKEIERRAAGDMNLMGGLAARLRCLRPRLVRLVPSAGEWVPMCAKRVAKAPRSRSYIEACP